MNQTELHTLGIDIGSTTVKIAVLDSNKMFCFLITSVTSPIFRKPFLICLVVLSTSSVRSRYLQ